MPSASSGLSIDGFPCFILPTQGKQLNFILNLDHFTLNFIHITQNTCYKIFHLRKPLFNSFFHIFYIFLKFCIFFILLNFPFVYLHFKFVFFYIQFFWFCPQLEDFLLSLYTRHIGAKSCEEPFNVCTPGKPTCLTNLLREATCLVRRVPWRDEAPQHMSLYAPRTRRPCSLASPLSTQGA